MSVEVRLNPLDLSSHMTDMRVWLDSHGVDGTGFSYAEHIHGATARVSFNMQAQAEAFAARFSGRIVHSTLAVVEIGTPMAALPLPVVGVVSAVSRHDKESLARYENAVLAKSVLQLATSIGLFLAACAAMYWALQTSYMLTLVLAIPTGALLVRVFIVQHDCGHGAFFASRRANDAVGMLCSLMTLTPYANWQHQHARHHGNWNNLDRRLSGADIYSSCLTLKEYRNLSAWQRFIYRLTRHPIIAHLLLPPFIFAVLYRVPFDTPRGWRRERRSVYCTDAALLVLFGALGSVIGYEQVLLVQVPILLVGSIVGVWLFAVQHRFETALWARREEWDFATAALEGSSYLRLPRVLQWFTGNIGFHHIHHLSPRVPNYRLEECYAALPALRAVTPLALWSALKSVTLILWDEDRRRLVGWREAHATPAARRRRHLISVS